MPISPTPYSSPKLLFVCVCVCVGGGGGLDDLGTTTGRKLCERAEGLAMELLRRPSKTSVKRDLL